MTITIVIGPPCSGKSTVVEKKKRVGDVVIDYDAIALAVGSSTPHDATGSIRKVALAARWGAINKVLSGIEDNAFILHTRPSLEQLQKYTVMGSKFLVVDPGKEVCLARARAEHRPEGIFQAIEAWYSSPPKIPSPLPQRPVVRL
jgi:hypothetical protein